MARRKRTILSGQDYDLTKNFEVPGSNYTTAAANALACWVRMTDQQPTDLGPNSLAGYYFQGTSALINNQDALASGEIGNVSVNYTLADGTSSTVSRLAAQFSDSSSDGVGTNSDDGRIQGGDTDVLFTTSLAFGQNASSAATDLPFSAVAWYRPEASITVSGVRQYVAAGQGFQIAHVRNGLAIRPQVKVFSGGGSSSGTDYLYRTSGVDQAINNWYHIAFTYDGSGSETGLKIYINGSEVSSYASEGEDGTYVGMDAPDLKESDAAFHTTGQNHISIGGHHNGSTELDGKVSEFAFWKNRALSADEISAIYNGSFYGDVAKITTDVFGSGIINNPPRTLLRLTDRSDGAYPASLRGCNSDFLGKDLAPFDDLNTPNFVNNFAVASIKFNTFQEDNSKVTFEDLTFVGITGSFPGIYRNFGFVNGASDNSKPSAPKFEYTYGDSIGVPVNLSGSSDPYKIAINLAKEINGQNMGIFAAAVGPQVNLTMQLPKTGSHTSNTATDLGTTIVSGNINNFRMDPKMPIEVTQFSSTDDVLVKYPYSLPSTFENIRNFVATPHATASIETFGRAHSGLTIPHVPVFSRESLKPFDDSRVHLEDSSFYRVGTPSTIFPGFESPLKSKSVITFDLISNAEVDSGLGTHIFYATSSLADGTDVVHKSTVGKSGSGMAYWNRARRTWEMLEPDHIDNHSNDPLERRRSCLGFSPSDGNIPFMPTHPNLNSSMFDLGSAVGNPVSEFGFPLASQYNATSSQCYDMSQHISSPFLVEKIVLEIEGEFGLNTMANSATLYDQPFFKQFFVLAQHTDGDNPHVTGSYGVIHKTQTTNPPGSGIATPVKIDALGHRELVGYAKIGFIRDDHPALPALNSRRAARLGANKDLYDRMVKAPDAAFNTAHGVSGSFTVEFEPSVASFSEGTSLLYLRDDNTASKNPPAADDYLLLTNAGAATTTGDFSGRQIGSSFSNLPITKIITTTDNPAEGVLPIEVRRQVRQHSPYLLMPQDRLIFGWQNRAQQVQAAGRGPFIATSDVHREERAIAVRQVDRISKAKVTLFGSHISNDVEAHNSFNENLTNNSVYSVVGADPISDHFDLSELHLLSGSMSDAIMVGRFFDNTRKRLCSVASRQSGTTGSLNRNIKHFNGFSFFKDSIFIDPFSMGAPPLITEAAIDGPAGLAEAIFVVSDKTDITDPTVTINGNVIDIAASKLNFVKLFGGGLFNQLSEMGSSKQETSDGVTDPGQKSTAGQFVSMPVNSSMMGGFGTTDPAESDGFYMMDALSAGASFGSQDSPNPNMGGDESMMGDGFANGAFFGHQSPATDPFDKIGGLNPLLVEIDQNGNASVISGSIYQNNAFLSQVFDGLNALKTPAARLLDTPQFRSLVGTCFTAEAYGTAGGVLSNAAGYFIPAGFNYGYSHAKPTPPAYHFSRRHFGFFSDLVETPGETALVVGTAGKQSPAVKVRFFSRGGEPDVAPDTTNSQNLSMFCTSSTPYDEGDGNVRDRSTTQPDLKDFITFSESLELNMDS